MYTLGVIIPAAGSGERMGTPVPKPFIEIDGKTILEYTVDKFLDLPFVERIVIPVGEKYIARVHKLFSSEKVAANKVVCVEGGSERQYSVAKALSYLVNPDLVAVHDAVRPLVSSATIRKCCDMADAEGAAVAGVPVRDTLKKVDEDERIKATTDRQGLWQAQTPQVFKLSLYRRALDNAEKTGLQVTDDAGLIEALGEPVYMIKGETMNIKLTYPGDLPLITTLLRDQSGK